MKGILSKIKHRLMKLRLQPIRVFCFHEVSDIDEGSPDWIPMEFFKKEALRLQNGGYEFITLKEAHEHIEKDKIRTKKYAVLTADDGLRCHLELLLWLKEHNIPITLCLNVTSPKQKKCGKPYVDWYGIKDEQTERKYAEQLYISDDELNGLDTGYVSFALHGVNHNEAATDLNAEELQRDIELCMGRYEEDAHFIPFYVYKYGKHTKETDMIVRRNKLIPVLSDGAKNYNDAAVIHREILENIFKQCQQK